MFTYMVSMILVRNGIRNILGGETGKITFGRIRNKLGHGVKEFRFVYYTGRNRRNGTDFGRVFLRSNYTDITQNTYIQS